jgi:hypothetical protein
MAALPVSTRCWIARIPSSKRYTSGKLRSMYRSGRWKIYD